MFSQIHLIIKQLAYSSYKKHFQHPRIHEGVIKGVELAYTASCDLWSIGATLYQAATAKLPFMPSRGARNDRLLMFVFI